MPPDDREEARILSGERASRIASIGYDYAAQPKTRVEACNLCGSDAHVGLTHRDRYGFRATAVACLRCGLVFLDPRLDAAAYGQFYEEVYRRLVSAYHGRRIDAETVEEEQTAYAETLVDLLEPHLAVGSSPRVLDVGGSTGVVSQTVRQRFGGTATVIDPAPAEVARAHARGLEAVVGTMEQYDHAGPPFTLVLMCQTIDHLLDVTSVLAKTRALVSDQALLFVDIVDFRAAYFRRWCVEEAIKIDHPFYLTEDTAESYLARAGFRLVRKEYAADRLHVAYLCTPSEPSTESLPSPESVRELLREVRFVQTAPPP
jgi:2-polyprenyl-3-methyl-5-hydroxy-6-metoxy-1,4-benzoquinol methylase